MFQLTDYTVRPKSARQTKATAFRIAMATLVSLSVAAGCLGVIEDCLHETVEYAKPATNTGKAIAKHQLVSGTHR